MISRSAIAINVCKHRRHPITDILNEFQCRSSHPIRFLVLLVDVDGWMVEFEALSATAD